MRITLFIILVAVLFSYGCLDKQSNECESVAPAAVTEVTGPTSTTLSQPVSFRMTFAINNGCGSYDHIETLTDGDTTEVVVKAKYLGCICTQQITYLQRDYVYTPMTSGTHYIRFYVSGQQFLTKILQVL